MKQNRFEYRMLHVPRMRTCLGLLEGRHEVLIEPRLDVEHLEKRLREGISPENRRHLPRRPRPQHETQAEQGRATLHSDARSYMWANDNIDSSLAPGVIWRATHEGFECLTHRSLLDEYPRASFS